MIEIRHHKTIATILNYLELPFARNAESLTIIRNKAFLRYEKSRKAVEIEFKMPSDIDIDINYFGNTTLQIWGGGIDTLIIEGNDSWIRCGYNTQGRIKYGRYYIPTLD